MSKNYRKKIFFSLLLFYILTLLQKSFLSHFALQGAFPNIVLIALLLFIFFENPQDNFSKRAGFIAGFFLDIFSNLPLGIATFSLVSIAFVSKRVLENFQKVNLFLILFFLVFASFFYEFLIIFFTFLSRTPLESPLIFLKNIFSYPILIQILYNSFLGIFIIWSFQILKHQKCLFSFGAKNLSKSE